MHVALVVHGTPHACAVALPAQDGLVLATVPPAPLAAPVPGAKMRLLVSRTRPPKLAEYLAGELDAELVPLGSAGAKTMAVIQGTPTCTRTPAASTSGTRPLPSASPPPAGCHCSRLDGSPLVYNRPDPYLPDLLVCRPELAETVLAAIRRAPDD